MTSEVLQYDTGRNALQPLNGTAAIDRTVALQNGKKLPKASTFLLRTETARYFFTTFCKILFV